jgi:hypothetical protein
MERNAVELMYSACAASASSARDRDNRYDLTPYCQKRSGSHRIDLTTGTILKHALRAIAVGCHRFRAGAIGSVGCDDDPLAHSLDPYAGQFVGILKGTQSSGWIR